MKFLLMSICYSLLFFNVSFGQPHYTNCPSIRIEAADGLVMPGNSVRINAFVADPPKDQSLYLRWSISNGTIIEGQGTLSIVVATTRKDSNTNPVVTIEHKVGDEDCTVKIIRVFTIGQIIEGDPVDRYGKTRIHNDLARMDGLIMHVLSDKDSKAYVSFEITKSEKISDFSRRLKRILRHFRDRKIAEERFIYDVCRAERNETTLWYVPDGAEIPVPDSCKEGKIDIKQILKPSKTKRIAKKKKA